MKIPKGKALLLPENPGYGQMVTSQGRFLYWIPGLSAEADELWRFDTEKRFRDWLALCLVTKRKPT